MTEPAFPDFIPDANPNTQVETQNDTEVITGLDITGYGGLPVVEQNQEYFVVFDEVGDTTPEIIDMSQYRITYLVDSKLNTSKPAEDAIAALNVTQNFNKGGQALMRADNATVLNQALSGIQEVYDVGTLALISTTETGSTPNAYITGMLFADPQGQDIVADAANVTSIFTIEEEDSYTNFAISGSSDYASGHVVLPFGTASVPISQSNGTDEYITYFTQSTDTNAYNYQWVGSTVSAGTRVKFRGNIISQMVWDKGAIEYYSQLGLPAPINASITIRYQVQVRYNGEVNYTNFGNPVDVIHQYPTNNFQWDTVPALNGGERQVKYGQWKWTLIDTPYKTWDTGDQIRIVATVPESENNLLHYGLFSGIFTVTDGPSYVQEPALTPGARIKGGLIRSIQEYSPGNVYIEGLNAISAPYWASTFSNYNPPDGNTPGYSIITSSAGFANFIGEENVRQRIDEKSLEFGFNPILRPLEFKVGDEIRFEYSKNQVHKVINVTRGSQGKVYLHLSPQVSGEANLNHFTHYRIIPDGGYIIAKVKKDNTAGATQDFVGIGLPVYPSKDLKQRQDQLIYELKQADIIEK